MELTENMEEFLNDLIGKRMEQVYQENDGEQYDPFNEELELKVQKVIRKLPQKQRKVIFDYMTETSNNNSDLNEFYYRMGLRDGLKLKETRDSQMKMTKEIEEFINLTITEHMGKSYADWKLSQSSVTEPDEVEEAYKKVIATLSPEQEEVITKYCDQIFNSGAETEEFFYRLGLKDGLHLKTVVKKVIRALS